MPTARSPGASISAPTPASRAAAAKATRPALRRARPDNSWVEVGERALRASFGRWLVQTPLANVTDVRVTGPYRFIRTAGPARLGVLERSLTFATNGERGVCIAFQQPVWGFDRLG